MESVIKDMKYETGKDNLTDEQINAIANEAIKESTAKDEQDDWKNPGDDEKTDDKPAEEKKDDTAKPDEDVDADDSKPKEDEKKDDQKIEEDPAKKAVEDKAAADKLKADKPFQIENRQKAIEDLALKDSMTLEEAEAQIVKDEATVNKYKGNPVELARALRQVQSYADRTKAELETAKKSATNPPAVVANNVKDYVEAQLSPIKEKIIASYRAEYPEISEGKEDTFIYGMIKKEAIDRTMKVLEESKTKLVGAAKEKRAELIMKLSDQDKAFLPDIKAIIDRTSDMQLMDKDFSVQDIIYWAKGKQVDRMIKEAEERGFKRGSEQPKILGEKTPTSKTPTPSGGAKKATLNDEQKQRALDMFDIPQMSDQDKYDAYIDTYPEEFTKKK